MIQRFIIDKNRKLITYKEDQRKVSVQYWRAKPRKHTIKKLAMLRQFYQYIGYQCVKATDKLEIYEKEAVRE